MTPRPLRRFRVVIDDTLTYHLTVEAADAMAAEDAAWELFASNERPDAERGDCIIIQCEEVAS